MRLDKNCNFMTALGFFMSKCNNCVTFVTVKKGEKGENIIVILQEGGDFRTKV